MISSNQFNKLIRQLDILIKLTAASLLKDKPKTEGITMLSNMGLEPKEIAEILGTTSLYVRVRKSIVKKSARKQKDGNEQKALGESSGRE